MADAKRHLFWKPGFGSLLLAAAVAVLGTVGISARSAEASGWVTTFEDNFDGSSLDTAKWFTRYIYDNGKMDHFNDEKQRYRDKGNHVLADGILSLVAQPPSPKGYY